MNCQQLLLFVFLAVHKPCTRQLLFPYCHQHQQHYTGNVSSGLLAAFLPQSSLCAQISHHATVGPSLSPAVMSLVYTLPPSGAGAMAVDWVTNPQHDLDLMRQYPGKSFCDRLVDMKLSSSILYGTNSTELITQVVFSIVSTLWAQGGILNIVKLSVIISVIEESSLIVAVPVLMTLWVVQCPFCFTQRHLDFLYWCTWQRQHCHQQQQYLLCRCSSIDNCWQPPCRIFTYQRIAFYEVNTSMPAKASCIRYASPNLQCHTAGSL